MKRFYRFLANNWQPAFIALVAVIVCAGLLWSSLGSLTAGVSKEELAYSASHANLRQVLDNPINLVHGTLTALPQLFNIHSALLLRTASALFGLIAIGAFYFVVRSWHTPRIAMLSSLLFASSSWFLHTARLGVPDITFTALIVLIMLALVLQQGRYVALSVLAMITVGSLLVYTPGMAWFIIPGALWQFKRINRALDTQAAWVRIICLPLILILLTPLFRALWLQPGVLQAILGLPNSLPLPKDVLTNLIEIPSQLFFRGPNNPSIWLGRLPLLDVFSMAMLAIGLYAYWFRRRLDRTRFLLGSSLFVILLVSLGGPVSLVVILPIIYIFVAAGMTLMLQQWFTVFPRNPLARIIGSTLLTFAVLLVCFYNINHYFIAWPNTPETKAVFTNKL